MARSFSLALAVNIPLQYAEEMARVGAVPSSTFSGIGTRFRLSGTPAVVTGEITRDDFLDRIVAAGLSRAAFEAAPAGMRFFTFSTD